jgi:superfamily II DNA or RNA helicase
LNSDLIFDGKRSFVIIATYSSFIKAGFQKLASSLPSDTLLIADEAHNVGANQVRNLLPSLTYTKRIGLSATPKRDFDDEGNAAIEVFFDSKSPYTFSFSMEKAIAEGYLCPYEYTPHIVYLDVDEMKEYEEISKQLSKMFKGDSAYIGGNEAVKMLLLKRKRIIHKATNKIQVFRRIIAEQLGSEAGLKYGFVYVPEGLDSDEMPMMDSFLNTINEEAPSVRVDSYTMSSENKDEVMRSFERGHIDILFAMKCLDEGVDIPRAELAVFCASTGTPRQFVQRRGRILRTHKDKSLAFIHDLVVFPLRRDGEEISTVEKKLIESELVRVVHFASLARNYHRAMEAIEVIGRQYDISIYALEYELDLYGSESELEE